MLTAHILTSLPYPPAAHFSENWGFVSLSPMLGGNVFSIAFGRNLDAHSDDGPAANRTAPLSPSSLPSLSSLSPSLSSTLTSTTSTGGIGARGGIPDPHHCVVGRECYADSLKMTIAACCLALALGVYAGWKDYRRQKRSQPWGGARGVGGGGGGGRGEESGPGPVVVVWDSEE